MSVIVKVIIAIVIGALLMTGIGIIINKVALPTAKDRVSTMFEQEYTPSINGGSGGGGVQPTTSPTLAAGLYDNNDNLLMSWSELATEYPDSIFVESGPTPDVSFGEMYGYDTLNGKLIIADSVTSIGAYAFQGCSSLTSIIIPNSVTSIGDCAFRGCMSLTSVTIPDGVTSIGEGVFCGCSSLTSITIPTSVKTIGTDAFCQCESLSSITIPNSVTSIGENAFSNCESLTSITIPDSVTSIGTRAFKGCTSLTSVTIPESVTSIGKNAFDGCSSGLTIYGKSDSYAETYADDWSYNFEAI